MNLKPREIVFRCLHLSPAALVSPDLQYAAVASLRSLVASANGEAPSAIHGRRCRPKGRWGRCRRCPRAKRERRRCCCGRPRRCTKGGRRLRCPEWGGLRWRSSAKGEAACRLGTKGRWGLLLRLPKGRCSRCRSWSLCWCCAKGEA